MSEELILEPPSGLSPEYCTNCRVDELDLKLIPNEIVQFLTSPKHERAYALISHQVVVTNADLHQN